MRAVRNRSDSKPQPAVSTIGKVPAGSFLVSSLKGLIPIFHFTQHSAYGSVLG
jgi:hypothetical protein